VKAKYKPLVVATFAVPDLTAGHVAFLKSFDDKVGSDRCDLVIATEASKAVREALHGIGARHVHSRLPDAPYLRAADAVNRIARDQPERPTLVVHARHTVFQTADVFAGYTPETVSVAEEGGVVYHDPVHKERWQEAWKWQTGLPTDLTPIPVVSRTVAAGPARLVAAYQTTLAALRHTKDPQTADFVLPSFLAVLAEGWSWHRLVPVETPWVAHGRSAVAVGIAFDKAVAVTKRSGEPYAILTDWDRVPGNEGTALWRKYT
jgi:hypothetical protein